MVYALIAFKSLSRILQEAFLCSCKAKGWRDDRFTANRQSPALSVVSPAFISILSFSA